MQRGQARCRHPKWLYLGVYHCRAVFSPIVFYFVEPPVISQESFNAAEASNAAGIEHLENLDNEAAKQCFDEALDLAPQKNQEVYLTNRCAFPPSLI